MDPKELDNKIEELERDLKEKKERERLLWIKKEYRGSDEVVPAEKYYSELKKETVLYKAFSGMTSLDKIIEGFRPGTLITVSGPTKQGKTVFFQTLTKNFTNRGFKCLWFPFDTPGFEIIERFGNSVPVFFLPKRMDMKDELVWIEEKIIEGLAKYNTRMIFIDHLEFLARFHSEAPNYSTELTSIVRFLKKISIKWNITIFLNHHIRQIAENTTPNWTQLKNSSGVAQDSDIVIMVWRERLSKGQTAWGFEYSNSSIVSVQLHRRTGKMGNLKLLWQDNIFTEQSSQNYGDKPF